MNHNNRVYFIAWRFYLVLGLVVLAVLGLFWRVFSLSILNQQFLQHQGNERVLRLINTPAFRGMIVDRRGFPLAVSTKVYSVWINPKAFAPTRETLTMLSNLLHIKSNEIESIITRNLHSKKEFVYLKRTISPEIAYKVNALHTPGLYTQQEYRRFYPEGEIAAQVVGLTNIDDQGQEGLELGYNQWLQGEPGKKWVIKDRLGRIIVDVKTIRGQKPGHDLTLSIDRRIQYLAYKELVQGIFKNNAHSGSAIVLDVKTGEVLAMVNQPSFNPNNRRTSAMSSFRNRAVTDTFEPGSTIKAFSIASALDSGHYKPNSMIDTSPGWMRLGKNLVHDEKDNGQLSIARILQVSSNMGVTRMVLGLPTNQLWDLLHRVGFGEITGVGFPGEQSGSLIKREQWSEFTLATLAFGYGMSVTPLQLARAYAILANDGIKIPVSLLRLDEPPQGSRVMDEQIAKDMLALLESVVTKAGTGKHAQVPGYRIAGKTGTAKMVGESGYEKHHYESSFVGIAPVSNPRLVVAVIIHDPQGKLYYGGDVSGPVFEKIMEGALRILAIPPDAEI